MVWGSLSSDHDILIDDVSVPFPARVHEHRLLSMVYGLRAAIPYSQEVVLGKALDKALCDLFGTALGTWESAGRICVPGKGCGKGQTLGNR